MGLESSDAAVVDDVLTLEFTMPDVKRPIKVTGRVRVKEVSGRTSIEFIDPMESGRDLIREYIYSKVIE
jgi:hypothetical protein